jgi:hypothetical protein
MADAEHNEDTGHNLELRRRTRRKGFLMIVIISTIIIINSLKRRLDPIPYHTSLLRGQEWLSEIMEGHPQHMHDQLGVSRLVFRRLLFDLCSSGQLCAGRSLAAEEKLGIYLFILKSNSTFRLAAERFQRSLDTVHK